MAWQAAFIGGLDHLMNHDRHGRDADLQPLPAGGHANTRSDRLPPERRLAERFGVSRNEPSRGLAQLESEGMIWRHVGRDTLVGARPVRNLADAACLREPVTPDPVVPVRLVIEPETARDASGSEISRIRNCGQRCREAAEWRDYEAGTTTCIMRSPRRPTGSYHPSVRVAQSRAPIDGFGVSGAARESRPKATGASRSASRSSRRSCLATSKMPPRPCGGISIPSIAGCFQCFDA